MPGEIVTIQVGQCGNQIGNRFWELALREHAEYATRRKSGKRDYDLGLSTFFRNVQFKNRNGAIVEEPMSQLGTPISQLRARAVLVDMEEGVINGILRGGVGDLFDNHQLLTDVSGAGNNWAHGYAEYGELYRDSLLEKVYQELEKCDSVQAFQIFHSTGGGTGSGLGSRILELLGDEFADIYRVSCSVIPSFSSDDVITSPYNNLMAMANIRNYSTCSLPMANDRFEQFIKNKNHQNIEKKKKNTLDEYLSHGKNPFDEINDAIAQTLLHFSSSVRFEGPLNVDLSDLITNMIPFPCLHFFGSSLSLPPISPIVPVSAAPSLLCPVMPGDSLRERFQQVVHMRSFFLAGPSADPQSEWKKDEMRREERRREERRGEDRRGEDTMQSDNRGEKTIAAAYILRGKSHLSEFSRLAHESKQDLHMWEYNSDGMKLGVTDFNPWHKHDHPALLLLKNSSSMGRVLKEMIRRFDTLFNRRAHLHHYTDYMGDVEYLMREAREDLFETATQYLSLERGGSSSFPSVSAFSSLSSSRYTQWTPFDNSWNATLRPII